MANDLSKCRQSAECCTILGYHAASTVNSLPKIRDIPDPSPGFYKQENYIDRLSGNVGMKLDSSWNVMAHGDTREGKWRGKLANGVGSQYPSHYLGTRCIQHYYRCWRTPRLPAVDWTDAPRADLNGLVLFARKTKSGFCACAIIFQTQSTSVSILFSNTLNVLSSLNARQTHIQQQEKLPVCTFQFLHSWSIPAQTPILCP